MTIVCYTVNNYILGNKIPRIGGKIVAQKRIDKTHTDVTVEFATKTEEAMADRILMVNRHPNWKRRCDTTED